MGQQQLLLLVLGIVIVGLAVVVGIQAFGENKTKAEVDRVTAEAVRMAAGATAWRMTPTAMGGGKGDASFGRFRLATLGIGGTATPGGDETVFDATTIRSVWNRDATGAGVTYIAVATAAYDAEAQVYLYGPTPNCLATRTRGAGAFAAGSVPARPAGCAW